MGYSAFGEDKMPLCSVEMRMGAGKQPNDAAAESVQVKFEGGVVIN